MLCFLKYWNHCPIICVYIYIYIYIGYVYVRKFKGSFELWFKTNQCKKQFTRVDLHRFHHIQTVVKGIINKNWRYGSSRYKTWFGILILILAIYTRRYKDVVIRDTLCSVISVRLISFATAKWIKHFSSKVDDTKDRNWEKYAVS